MCDFRMQTEAWLETQVCKEEETWNTCGCKQRHFSHFTEKLETNRLLWSSNISKCLCTCLRLVLNDQHMVASWMLTQIYIYNVYISVYLFEGISYAEKDIYTDAQFLMLENWNVCKTKEHLNLCHLMSTWMSHMLLDVCINASHIKQDRACLALRENLWFFDGDFLIFDAFLKMSKISKHLKIYIFCMQIPFNFRSMPNDQNNLKNSRMLISIYIWMMMVIARRIFLLLPFKLLL